MFVVFLKASKIQSRPTKQPLHRLEIENCLCNVHGLIEMHQKFKVLLLQQLLMPHLCLKMQLFFTVMLYAVLDSRTTFYSVFSFGTKIVAAANGIVAVTLN